MIFFRGSNLCFNKTTCCVFSNKVFIHCYFYDKIFGFDTRIKKWWSAAAKSKK